MITRRWTIMTWIVVVGLMLVMLLWILIYSFFMSADFIDKMLILFGSIQFLGNSFDNCFACSWYIY